VTAHEHLELFLVFQGCIDCVRLCFKATDIDLVANISWIKVRIAMSRVHLVPKNRCLYPRSFWMNKRHISQVLSCQLDAIINGRFVSVILKRCRPIFMDRHVSPMVSNGKVHGNLLKISRHLLNELSEEVHCSAILKMQQIGACPCVQLTFSHVTQNKQVELCFVTVLHFVVNDVLCNISQSAGFFYWTKLMANLIFGDI